MKDLKEFIETNDKGELLINYDAYNAELNSELDRARTQASETAKANAEKQLKQKLEKEIKAQLEKDATLTAEDKLKAEREAFIAEKRDFDIQRIKRIYEDVGISAEEIEMLTALIGDDSEQNLANAQKFAKARKLAYEDSVNKIKEELQQSQRRGNASGGTTDNDNIGALKAKEIAQKYKNGYVSLKPELSAEVKLD